MKDVKEVSKRQTTNKRTYILLIGMALVLATASVSQAMSRLVSLSVEPEWPSTSTPGNTLLYRITVVRQGAGLLNVSLSSLGLPEGATVTFSPSPLRFTGNRLEVLTATMTVTCPTLTSVDNYPFTVTGSAARDVATFTNHAPQQLFSLVAGASVLFLDRMSDGSLRLRGTGAGGKTYAIEAATNLQNPVWTSLGSTTADGNGRFTFVSPLASDLPVRFFRAVSTTP